MTKVNSEEKEQALNCLKAGMSIKQIVAATGLSDSAIGRWKRDILGVHTQKSHKKARDCKGKAFIMFDNGFSAEQVGKAFELGRTTVNRWLQIWKSSHPSQPTAEAKQPELPIPNKMENTASKNHKAEAFVMFDNGYTFTQVADKFKLSHGTVGHWLEKWKEEKKHQVKTPTVIVQGQPTVVVHVPVKPVRTWEYYVAENDGDGIPMQLGTLGVQGWELIVVIPQHQLFRKTKWLHIFKRPQPNMGEV